MRQDFAQRRIKGLQKDFLLQVERHPILHQLDATAFNDLRKRVFRGTFEAYRLGVVGINGGRQTSLSQYFFGWLEDAEAVKALDLDVRREVTEMCFHVALEAYRIGALVAVFREAEAA